MRIIFISCFFILSLFAKQDFFYGFMDNNGNQIDIKTKKQIRNGFLTLENIRKTMNDGDIPNAYAQIKQFDKANKLPILKSDVILLTGEILLRQESKRFKLEGEKLLEGAINSSQIKEESLPDAYRLLVNLKIAANKANEAKYFAQTIIDNYSDPLKQAYGKIAMAEIAIYQKDYGKATKILYEVLSKTNDINIATVVADKLFDVYVSDEKVDKAYELIEKVLKTNIGYYLNDINFAIRKADTLIKADMPEFGIKILEEVLKKTTNPTTVENIKMKLANTYMVIIDLAKAKEYYKDIITDYMGSPNAQKAKMGIDEILMRENKLEPSTIADRYKDSTAMQQKALLQELLNYKAAKKYAHILKSKKVYDRISDQITKRFGYNSMHEIYNDVQIALIKEYLNADNCDELEKITQDAEADTLHMLITDDTIKNKFFECLVEVPNERTYNIAKEAFNETRNAQIYLYLEKVSFELEKYDESLIFSNKVAMLNDKQVLEKEFLQKYLTLKTVNDDNKLNKLFYFASKNPNYLEANKKEPVILDFYYDYYLYLLDNKEKYKANDILIKFANLKKEYKVRAYSPFVEIELANLAKDKKDYKKQVEYLEDAIKKSPNLAQNNAAKIYYELMKAYQALKQKTTSNEYLKKCKATTDNESIWKKMCDKM